MGFSALLSVLLHVLLFGLLIFGLPFKKNLQDNVFMPIPVEFVPLGPETTAPKPVIDPKKNEDKKELDQPKKVKTQATSTPKEEPKPEVKPHIEDVKPQPEAPPVSPLKKPDPKPVDKDREALEAVIKELEKASPKEEKPPVEKKPPEKKKDKPEEKVKDKPKKTFDSILKNIMKNKEQGDIIDPKESTDGSSSSQTGKVSDQLNMSEMDLIRQQISKCWNIPAGAREATDLVVEVKVWMNIDGTVKDARLEASSGSQNPFYRTASESALRAVRDQRCLPLKLPPEKYERWKTFVLSFNPKDLL